MKKKILIALFAIMSAVISAKTVFLTDAGGNPVISNVTEDGVKISLVGKILQEENTMRFVATIENKSDKVFSFNENNIRCFQGNMTSDYWIPLSYYGATSYLSMKKAENDAAAIAAGLGLGLAVFDALVLPPYGGYNYRGYRPDYHSPHRPSAPHRPSGPAYGPHHFRHYGYDSLLDSIIGLGVSAAIVSALLEDTDYTVDHLKEALLFNKDVQPGETYTGYFVTKYSAGPDYKISLAVSDEEKLDYVFIRSDRDAILHPWSDYSEERFCFNMGPSFTLKNAGLNIGFVYCGQPIGCYFTTCADFSGAPNEIGIIYDSGLIDFQFQENRYLNATFSPNGNQCSDFLSFEAGLTFTFIPHTWFMAGCGVGLETMLRQGDVEIEYLDKTASKENVWLREYKSQVYCIPQIGVTAVFNYISFGGTFGWRIGYPTSQGPVFNTFVGFAF